MDEISLTDITHFAKSMAEFNVILLKFEDLNGFRMVSQTIQVKCTGALI